MDFATAFSSNSVRVSDKRLTNVTYFSLPGNFYLGNYYLSPNITSAVPLFSIKLHDAFENTTARSFSKDKVFGATEYDDYPPQFLLGYTQETPDSFSFRPDFLIADILYSSRMNSDFVNLKSNDFVTQGYSPLVPLFSLGFLVSASNYNYFPFLPIGLEFSEIVNISADISGFNFGIVLNSFYSLIHSSDFLVAFDKLTTFEILFGRTSYQNTNNIVITKSQLGIINNNQAESILAGILFNSVYAFADSEYINSKVWEIKSIEEDGNRFLYGVIVIEFKEVT